VKDRMMMIGWALPDFHGAAGPGVGFLTRLTLLREVNFDVKTMNLVANPLPELKGLRTGSLASEKNVALAANPAVVKGTEGGAASSADVEITFKGKVSNCSAPGCVFGACVLANASHEGLGIKITSTGASAVVVVGACSSLYGDVEDESLKASPFPIFDEDEITVRITPDRSLADFFVQGGRFAGTVAWQAKDPRKAADSAVLLWSKSEGVTADVNVYGMGCGWLNPSYTEHPTL